MPFQSCTQCLLFVCWQLCWVSLAMLCQSLSHNTGCFPQLSGPALFWCCWVWVSCWGGGEIGPPIQLFWVPVSKGNVVVRGGQRVCTSGAASGHILAWRCLACARCSPFQFYTTIQISWPIFDEFVFCSYAFHKGVSMLFANIFYNKVIHNKGEWNGTSFVFPQVIDSHFGWSSSGQSKWLQ